LTFQIRDLLFGVRDLLIAFGYLVPEILNLALQPLIFPLQLFATGLVGAPMVLRRCLWLSSAASRSRTHPPYSKQFAAICSAPETAKYAAKIRYNHIHYTVQRVRRRPHADDSIPRKIASRERR
jgi:hypothetical protein